MEQSLLALPLLACPVGMGLMMWFMSRGMRRDRTDDRAPEAPLPSALRAEQAELERDIVLRSATDTRDDELVPSAR